MTKTPRSLQDLQRRIEEKAKAEPAWRCWGLYVPMGTRETLREAYRVAQANTGAPGMDGGTFEALEASGVEPFLEHRRDALVARTYQPRRVRRQAIPKDGGRKVRVLGIPTIRDRVVQGALKLILEPLVAAHCPPGSYGYRPKRSAHAAVQRVAEALAQDKTRGIAVALQACCANGRPHVLWAKVAQRINDAEVRHVRKSILKTSGRKGVPPGGVRSPLRSNLDLTEVERRLERAKEVTRRGQYTDRAYARFADALVIVVEASRAHAWLRHAGDTRLRQAGAVLQVAINEEKSRLGDLAHGATCSVLGLDFRRVKRRRGVGRPWYTPRQKKRTALLRKLKDILRRYASPPVERVVARINPLLRGWVRYCAVGDACRCCGVSKDGVEQKVRRPLMRARNRQGFGWQRWRRRRRYDTLRLFNAYRGRRPQPTALPVREVP